ncbi:response regulator transcription factor [Paenibacillus psychroresistens]|nr:response regulator [Paenibacillus psychroresistens]
MYKVLIAEDEMLVRLGLKHSVAWDQYGMQVVADAENGQEAWEHYENLQPDILITDLKMPLLHGMDLIVRIREQDKKLKIIILSCLDEFDMVRKALSHGVSDYILKLTMTEAEIGKVLSKIKHELDEQAGSRSSFPALKREDLVERIVKDYLFRNLYKNEEFTDILKKFNIQTDSPLLLCMMDLDQYDLLQTRFQDERGQLIRMSLLNVLEEVIAGRGLAIHDEGQRYLLIFNFPQQDGKESIMRSLDELLEEIRKVFQSYFNVTVTVAVSSIHEGYSGMRSQYNECEMLMKRKFLRDSAALLLLEENADFEKGQHHLQVEIEAIRKEAEAIGQLLPQELNKLINTILDESFTSINPIKRLFIQWMHFSLLLLGLTPDGWPRFVNEYSDQIEHCMTFKEILRVFREYLHSLLQYQQNRKQMSYEVVAVISYIEANYHRELSLSEAAEAVMLSPNYLTSLFKKETELNFLEYLINFRVEKAKELLLGTYLKSYEISEKVGFEDHSHFSRTFKKWTGLSPRDFRRRWVNDWVEEVGSDANEKA